MVAWLILLYLAVRIKEHTTTKNYLVKVPTKQKERRKASRFVQVLRVGNKEDRHYVQATTFSATALLVLLGTRAN